MSQLGQLLPERQAAREASTARRAGTEPEGQRDESVETHLRQQLQLQLE